MQDTQRPPYVVLVKLGEVIVIEIVCVREGRRKKKGGGGGSVDLRRSHRWKLILALDIIYIYVTVQICLKKKNNPGYHVSSKIEELRRTGKTRLSGVMYALHC